MNPSISISKNAKVITSSFLIVGIFGMMISQILIEIVNVKAIETIVKLQGRKSGTFVSP